MYVRGKHLNGLSGYMRFFSEFAWKQWPDGNYAIPMTVYGCPDQETNNWKHKRYGHLLMEQSIYKVDDTVTPSLRYDFVNLGPFDDYEVRMNLCVKQPLKKQNDIYNEDSFEERMLETAEWPPGNYAIYPKTNVCPKGK